MQGRLHVESLKSAGNGPCTQSSERSHQNKTQNQKKQTNRQNTQNHNKTKTKKHREVGSLPALRKEKHDDILCVIMSMATENEAKRRQHGTTLRGHEKG